MGSQQNTEIPVPNFAGGQCSAKGVGTLGSNEFFAMQNVILDANGDGFRCREGNTAVNSTAVAAGLPFTGLGYLRTITPTEYLVGTAGTGIYAATGLVDPFADITGSVTVTSGQNNFWHIFQSDDKLIGVGGAPNAPWKYTGTGSAALLGGSPPTGRFGFQYGNRTFIGSTTADPSKIYWSVLLNSEDWSGTGSGSQDIEPNDGDFLVTAAPINLNTVILFKQNSIYLLTGRESPFPVFPLFSGIGCVGTKACVVYQGLAYFITTDAKMCITDGNQIINQTHLPDVDDVWDAVRDFRLPYIQGVVVNGKDFDWLIWSVTKSATSTNEFAVVWDLRNQCWLTCPTGFEANAFATTLDRTVYMGGYDGKAYRLFAPNTFTDASNSSANVSFKVDSDWITLEGLLSVKQVQRANILHQTRATGTMTFSYGYDFNEALTTVSFSIAQAGGALWDTAIWDAAVWDGYSGRIANIFNRGRGNVYKWRLSGSSGVGYDVSSVSLFGRNKSQRMFDAVA